MTENTAARHVTIAGKPFDLRRSDVLKALRNVAPEPNLQSLRCGWLASVPAQAGDRRDHRLGPRRLHDPPGKTDTVAPWIQQPDAAAPSQDQRSRVLKRRTRASQRECEHSPASGSRSRTTRSCTHPARPKRSSAGSATTGRKPTAFSACPRTTSLQAASHPCEIELSRDTGRRTNDRPRATDRRSRCRRSRHRPSGLPARYWRHRDPLGRPCRRPVRDRHRQVSRDEARRRRRARHGSHGGREPPSRQRDSHPPNGVHRSGSANHGTPRSDSSDSPDSSTSSMSPSPPTKSGLNSNQRTPDDEPPAERAWSSDERHGSPL